jgi:hypothetical protein
MKFSAAASLGLGRRACVSAISSAHNLHLLTSSQSQDLSSDSSSFFNVLEAYTKLGVNVVHNSFCLAELITLSTFHLTANTIKFSLETAEEMVLIFDGLFGETDTSKAVAAVITLIFEELKGQDDALGFSKRFGKVYALGQLTKSMIAYCCSL